MRTRIFFFLFGLVIFLSGAQSAFASIIFSQTPSNEDLNGPILNSSNLVMFGCPNDSNYCEAYGKTVYNIGVWIKKVGNPADIRLQITDSIWNYPASDTSNLSNSISASSISDTSYTLKWFYFPNGVVIGSNQFFLFQFTGANNTYSGTNYYRALYDPDNSYNVTQQWCKISRGCWSSIFYWMMDDGKTDLSLPPPPPDPCATPGACASNVLFLPGIEASRLYRPDGSGGDKKLWEPSLNDTLQGLYLNQEGKSIRNDVYTKTGDVVDETPVTGANIYKSFIVKMNGLVTAGTINAWEADPYDWRLSLDDILTYGKQTGTHISYLDATSTPYIIQELKHLAATSKTHKVTIVAHSNGGLVAKKLTELLGPEAGALIDKMIFVAVPQAGTPAAIAADLHGYDQNFGFGPVVYVSPSTARTFASTSPMAYNLLPSEKYFKQIDTPVVTFDASLPDWISRYGAAIHSEPGLRAFLTDVFGRVDAQTGDINQPIQSSATLLANAEAMHADLDAWTPPAGVQLIQIAGWGVPTTVSSITYKKKDTGVRPEANFTVDGDGTVVVPSALWTSTTTGVTNYWVDLKRYSNDHWLATLGGLHPFNHANILETDPTLNFISDKIASTTKPHSDYTYLSTQAPSATGPRLRYALHSPLTLNLYDDMGRHTGVSTTTGKVEEQIPGTYYTEFGDVKYLFSDTSESAHVLMDGYAPGTFTFNVDQYSGDTLTASTTFKDIPTSASTIVVLDVQSDISTLSPMQIDKNGDGTFDVEIAPRMNDIAIFPKVPVTITAEDKTVLLGAPLPVPTAALSATSSDITGAPDCTVNVATTTAVGAYPITCTIGTLASPYYDFTTLVPGTLNIQYRWDGFTQPMSGTAHQVGQSMSIFKGGSTIPVKFQLKDINGTPVQAATAPLWYTDGGTSSVPYKWDSTAQQYVYNWSTKGLATGGYKIYAKLDDGQTYAVTVGLK